MSRVDCINSSRASALALRQRMIHNSPAQSDFIIMCDVRQVKLKIVPR